VITSFKTQSNYFQTNPLAPPTEPTLDNYKVVIEADFVRYFINSVIITLGAVVPAVLVSFMAAYAVVRAGDRWVLRSVNSLFLMGLAIPLQAAIIPIYLIIIRLHLYDTLLAIILPSIAFAIPRRCWCCPTSSGTSPRSSSTRCGWTAPASGAPCGTWPSP
jgi:raffinose/stachyose/melibiose transport system permease protein